MSRAALPPKVPRERSNSGDIRMLLMQIRLVVQIALGADDLIWDHT